MSAIDYKALAERLRKHADRLDETREALGVLVGTADDPAADLRAVVSLLRECAEAEPVAWMHDDDSRVISNETMQGAIQDGGAILSSLRGYTIPLYERPQPAQPPEGWQWVPKKSTDGMHIAYTHAKYEGPQPTLIPDLWRAMLDAAPTPPARADVLWPVLDRQVRPKCGCRSCLTPAELLTTFVVCPQCGNKRCPKADDHRNACTDSNDRD